MIPLPIERTAQSSTVEDMIWTLWRMCLTTAREVGAPPAGAVKKLIADTRDIIAEQGYGTRDSDFILLGVYTVIHWDFPHPTARCFETLLNLELAEFFRERGIN